MSTISPAAAIRAMPERSFIHVDELPGSAVAARQAASRAARHGELLRVRRGLYYRGAKTRYGLTPPRVEEVAREIFGDTGTGPTEHSAARAWGVTTQLPSSFHVATLWKVDPIEGVVQHSRRNKERARLSTKEIALLELMRAPEVYVESGWNTLVDKVHEAFAADEIHKDALLSAVKGERNSTVRTNFAKLLPDTVAA